MKNGAQGLRAVFAGGGTGGHLYPILAVADSIKEAGGLPVFIGTERGVENEAVPARGYKLYHIQARGLAGGVLGKLRAVSELFIGFAQSFFILLREKPDIVIGSGGYVCAPAVAAAKLLRIPAICLEQNAFAGKAVKFLSRLADRVCISLPGSEKGLPQEKVVLTGNPIRKAITEAGREEARQRLNIAPDRKCLLVTGASQGALSINNAVLAALPLWRKEDWTVIHLTGPKHIDEVSTRSHDLTEGYPIDYRPLGYMEDIAYAYAAADLCVCRAGATTLAEVTASGVPALLIPYPHAAENHQEANAETLARAGAAVVVKDSSAENELGNFVLELINNDEKLKSMRTSAKALGKGNAAALVVEEALKLLKRF